MIAFWKYSGYPYCLWGKVAEYDADKGKVYIESYRGWFEPTIILPDLEAEEIIEQLTLLKQLRSDRMNEVKELFNEKLRNVAPFLDK